MPQIIVTTDADDQTEARVLFKERVAPSHFRSTHFSTQLVERLGWAVADAEPQPGASSGPASPNVAQ